MHFKGVVEGLDGDVALLEREVSWPMTDVVAAPVYELLLPTALPGEVDPSVLELDRTELVVELSGAGVLTGLEVDADEGNPGGEPEPPVKLIGEVPEAEDKLAETGDESVRCLQYIVDPSLTRNGRGRRKRSFFARVGGGRDL